LFLDRLCCYGDREVSFERNIQPPSVIAMEEGERMDEEEDEEEEELEYADKSEYHTPPVVCDLRLIKSPPLS